MNEKENTGLTDAVDKIHEFVNSGKKVVHVEHKYSTPKSAQTIYASAIKRLGYDKMIRTHRSEGELFLIRNIDMNANTEKGNKKAVVIANKIQEFVNSGKKAVCMEHEYSTDDIAVSMYKIIIERLGYGEMVCARSSRGDFFLFRTDICIDESPVKRYGKIADATKKIREFIDSGEKIAFIEHGYSANETARVSYYNIIKHLGYDEIIRVISSNGKIFLIRNDIHESRNLKKYNRKIVDATNRILEFIISGEKVAYIESEYTTINCAYTTYKKIIERLGYSKTIRLTVSKMDCFLVRNDI